MKTAEEIEQFIDYRDTLHKELRGGVMMYDVPKYYRWLSEKDLIEYWINHVHTSHPTTLPSDEEIHDNAERVPNLNFDEEIGYILGAKWMRSLCEAKIAEMEREKPSLQDRLFTLANDFAVAKQGDIAVRLHSIHNSITSTT